MSNCKTISVCNQKGGVGKTTTTVNLGVGLAMQGKKVLLIDADPQGDLTTCLGWQDTDGLGITLATKLTDVINETMTDPMVGILHHEEGVDLVPANLELSAMEFNLVNAMSRETTLKNYLCQVKNRYDYVIIDCMPSLGMVNLLQENGMRIAGLKIDINPISLEKTGTLQEYMKRAEQYLDEREAEKQGRTPQETVQEPKISFYAAECMEFPSMGEYYENLTLEEAVEKYKTIPEDRIHGIKGIGFCLEDGSIYDGEYELMSGGKISKDLIDLVPHYKESPLVQKAMRDLERILAEKQRENTAEQAKPEGTMGRKVSVLKALKERKELLKKQEKKEETSHTRKKEAEL